MPGSIRCTTRAAPLVTTVSTGGRRVRHVYDQVTSNRSLAEARGGRARFDSGLAARSGRLRRPRYLAVGKSGPRKHQARNHRNAEGEGDAYGSREVDIVHFD